MKDSSPVAENNFETLCGKVFDNHVLAFSVNGR